MEDKRSTLLKEILKIIDEQSITAYEISKNTSLSNVGIQKIINGDTQRPSETTLNIIYQYLTNKQRKLNNNLLNEPHQETYEKKNKKTSFKGLPIDEKLNILFQQNNELKKELYEAKKELFITKEELKNEITNQNIKTEKEYIEIKNKVDELINDNNIGQEEILFLISFMIETMREQWDMQKKLNKNIKVDEIKVDEIIEKHAAN